MYAFHCAQLMLNTEVMYREASASDFYQLKQLGNESYAEFSQVLTEDNWAKMNAFLESEETLKKLIDQSTVFVCERGSDLIGMIYLVSSGNPTELFEKNWSYIRYLGVDPAYRGYGIGSKLADLCLDRAKQMNETHVALHTSDFMAPAPAIYEKRGFRKIKEIDYLGKPYWIYLLELKTEHHDPL